jgi:hypothetical protein
MMSLTTTFSSAATPEDSRASISRCAAQASALTFSSLPSTSATSGMAANVLGSVCAAQPVTTMRACGCSRLSLRMAWRDCRTASAVTAHVFTTTVSASPAACACRRITSAS